MQAGLTGQDDDAKFDESEEDDETTIAKEERLTKNIEQEVNDLNEDANMEYDAFLSSVAHLFEYIKYWFSCRPNTWSRWESRSRN